MKKLLFALMLFSSISLSAQDLIVTYQQDVMRRISHYESTSGERVSAYFTRFSPGIKASWRGITAGLNYDDDVNLFFYHAGYTLTITPQACLRTYGEGIKVGFTLGQSFTVVNDWFPNNYQGQGNFSLGYQRKRWQAEVFMRVSEETNYGIGIGYAFM